MVTLTKQLSSAAILIFCFASPSGAQVVTVGAMAELTGAFAKLGEDCRKGYEIAKNVYAPEGKAGSFTINVIIGDNGGDAKTGITEFERLTNREHAIGIVTTRSPVGLAVSALSQKREIPVVGVVGHPKFISGNPLAFRVFPSADAEGEGLLKSIQQLNKSRVAVISLEDDYFLGLGEKIVHGLGKNRIVFAETVLPSEQDFSAIASKLKTLDPDAVVLNVGPAQISTLAKRLKAQDITCQLFSNFLLSMPDVLAATGGAAEGIRYVEMEFEKQRFLDKSQELFGDRHSSAIGYSCYVGLSALLQSIAQSIAIPDNKSLTTKLQQMRNLDLLDEKLSFVDREAQMTLQEKQIQNGKPQKV